MEGRPAQRAGLRIAVAAAGVLLAACRSPQPAPTLTASSATPVIAAPTATPAAPTPLAPTAASTTTPLPPTATATPTLHPMSIAAMRLGQYPGSDIVLEQQLDDGANYQRYYASYQSGELKIYALLTIPDGERPATGWPVIVFNHGYIPPNEYRTTQRYVAYVDRLARSGYIVFRPDYRGHDQSDGVATGAYGSPGYTVDVLNAVASVRRFSPADPERIGMWGHSMGGFLTLRAMVIDPGIKAGVIWAGVVASYPDMITRWRSRPTPTPDPNSATPAPSLRGWRGGWVTQYGAPDENPDFWASISANSYLSDISGPLQLHHGTADASVPLIFSELLSAEMQAADKTVELYEYDGDNHNLSGYFTLAMNRTIEFFDVYLKNAGD